VQRIFVLVYQQIELIHRLQRCKGTLSLTPAEALDLIADFVYEHDLLIRVDSRDT
jgi:hypothetical protein